MKNRLILNLLATFVILIGGAFLTMPENNYAATSYTINATCSCDSGNECEGDRCKCKDDGSCSACDNYLGFIPCKT